MRWIHQILQVGLVGLLLTGTACDQDRPTPLAFAGPAGSAQLQIQLIYGAHPDAKPTQGDEVRVLVWHLRDLSLLQDLPVTKPAQLPDLDFWRESDPNDWATWSTYLQQQLGLDQAADHDHTLAVEGNEARATLQVLPGEKHVFVGRFIRGVLSHTGETQVVVEAGQKTRVVIELERFVLPDALEFASAQLEAAVRAALSRTSGTLFADDVAELRTLEARARNIDDLGGIEQLTGLRQLFLSGNHIDDLAQLINLVELQELDLCNNQVADVSSLADLVNLTTLTLCQNQIVDPALLATLLGLRTLDLSNNQIVDVSSLAALTDLRELNLSNNRIVDITALLDLAQLTQLDLRNNPLSTETIVENISDLIERGLSPDYDLPESEGGGIGDIVDRELVTEIGRELLRNLTENLNRLDELSVTGQNISDLSGLHLLSQLGRLNLQGNQISDLGPLLTMTELNELDLRDNQISDLAALVVNPGLGEGDTVDLRGNPLSQDAIDNQIPALQARGVEVLFDEE